MPRLQKYEQKVRKYKEKLKKLITRIGISYIDEFELNYEIPEKLLLPCHVGFLFFGEYDKSLFEKIQIWVNNVFDSFFFSVRDLGTYDFSFKLIAKGVKTEYSKTKKVSRRLKMHPTNKFYQILIEKRIKENLGMIVAVTDLPLYSSNDDTILFLFGETHLKHRCCVISTLKLKEQFYNRLTNVKIFEKRIIKEIIHEIGHIILGADHCFNNSCVMRFSHDVGEIDEKSCDFCINCRTKLEKIKIQNNF